MLLPLVIGFAFGYIGSMPVAGPISVLVLHLGLAHNSRLAFYVAVGGALAEALYALVAFWGLSTVLASYPVVLPAAKVVGACILLVLGLVMLFYRVRGATPAVPAARRARGGKRSLVLGFLITAINPSLMVTWTAAVAALNATGLLAMERRQALPFAAAAGAGIVAWFATLLWLVGKWRNRLSIGTLARFMKAMGAVLVAAGSWMVARFVTGLLRP
jgi:threonine/homoserine/homoserine lactone efflux protein